MSPLIYTLPEDTGFGLYCSEYRECSESLPCSDLGGMSLSSLAEGSVPITALPEDTTFAALPAMYPSSASYPSAATYPSSGTPAGGLVLTVLPED